MTSHTRATGAAMSTVAEARRSAMTSPLARSPRRMGVRRSGYPSPAAQSLLDPRIDPPRPPDAHDLAPAHEHLRRQGAAVVLAGHREAVGARVADHDARRRRRERVLPEVVGALAHRPHDAPAEARAVRRRG